MKAPNLRGYARHPIALLAEDPANMSEVGYEKLLSTFLQGRSQKTRRAYLDDLKTLAIFLGEPSIPSALQFFLSDGPGFANRIALGLKEHLNAQNRASATVNRKLATLRSIVKMSRTIGFLSWQLDVENVRSVAYRNTAGPGTDVVRLMFNLFEGKEDPKSRRDCAILHLLFDLGLRRNEIASLDLSDIEGGKISVLGKGKREKIRMSLPEGTQASLQKWIQMRGCEAGPLFTNFDRARKGARLTGNSIYRIVQEMSRDCGKECTPHQIRHSSITQACKVAAREGIGLEMVRQFSRHADVRTLMIYRDNDEDMQGHLANLVAKAVE
jgi:integrase/recombinase XerC